MEEVLASAILDRLMRTRLAPGLRQLGFRGSGMKFGLPDEGGNHALLGLQKHPLNDAAMCRFTVNLAFFPREQWERLRVEEPWLPKEPNPNDVHPSGWTRRLGQLLDPPRDLWWSIDAASDVNAVAEEVLDLIRDIALPELLARLANSGRHRLHARDSTAAERPLRRPSPTEDEAEYVSWDAANNEKEGVGLDGRRFRPREYAVLKHLRHRRVPRTQAWKLLHIQRRRLERYADGMGAGNMLSFGELLAVQILSIDEMLPANLWPQAAAEIIAWAEQLPDADTEQALRLSSEAWVMMRMEEAMPLDENLQPVDDPRFGISVVYPLVDQTQLLLDEMTGGEHLRS